MKKIFFTTIATVVGIASYFSYNSMVSNREFTETEMENIEALAEDEVPTVYCPPAGLNECARVSQDTVLHIFYSYIKK
jgi:hypothetical protein